MVAVASYAGKYPSADMSVHAISEGEKGAFRTDDNPELYLYRLRYVCSSVDYTHHQLRATQRSLQHPTTRPRNRAIGPFLTAEAKSPPARPNSERQHSDATNRYRGVSRRQEQPASSSEPNFRAAQRRARNSNGSKSHLGMKQQRLKRNREAPLHNYPTKEKRPLRDNKSEPPVFPF